MPQGDPGNAGNPFQSLLGDLLNVLGSAGAPDQWTLTSSFAVNVATGGEPEPNVEPVLRIQLEQLARVAELNVMEATGLPVAPDGRRLTCVAVGRSDWTMRALDSWRPILSAMAGPSMSHARRACRGDRRLECRRRGHRRSLRPAGTMGERHRTHVLRAAGGFGGRAPGPAGPRPVPAGSALGTLGRAARRPRQHRRLRQRLEPPGGGGTALGVRP